VSRCSSWRSITGRLQYPPTLPTIRGVTHYNSDLADVDPNELVPDGKLRLLVASPECTHFSKARGGKPKSKQSRASIKYVLRWIGVLDVENLLVENVPEFVDWGPLHRSGPRENKPIKARRGEFFKRFLAKLRSAGYTVEWRIINAADYGDATTRKRLFIMARKGNPITWPVASHSRHSHDLAGGPSVMEACTRSDRLEREGQEHLQPAQAAGHEHTSSASKLGCGNIPGCRSRSPQTGGRRTEASQDRWMSHFQQ